MWECKLVSLVSVDLFGTLKRSVGTNYVQSLESCLRS